MPLQDAFKRKTPAFLSITKLSTMPSPQDLLLGLDLCQKPPYKPILWSWPMGDGQTRMLSVQKVNVGGSEQGLWELRASEDTGSAPMWSYPTMDPAAIHNVLMQEVRSSGPAHIPENLRPSGERNNYPPADLRASQAAPPPPVTADPYPRPDYVRPNDPYAPDPYQR